MGFEVQQIAHRSATRFRQRRLLRGGVSFTRNILLLRGHECSRH